MDRINRYQGVNLYVKNLDDVVDDERLRKEFSRFGTITSARVMSEGGRSKGFGFVCFSSPEEATKAVTEMNGSIIVSRPLYVALAQRKEDRRTHLASQRLSTMRQQEYAGRAQKKAEQQAKLKDKFEKIKMDRINRYQGVNLYVKNLDDVVDDERLRKEFSRFGTITSARVMSEGGRSKGFGFVCFSSPEEATKAVTEMNGSIIVSRPLYVALAQRKEDRSTHLASQYMQRMNTMRQQEYAGRAQKKAEQQAELKDKFEKIKMDRINRYQGVNLYVKNLDDVVDDERLRKEFSRFGTITSARQTAQFNEMFQPTGAGYFVPTMPQAQRDCASTQMPDVCASPRWQTQVRPTQPAGESNDDQSTDNSESQITSSQSQQPKTLDDVDKKEALNANDSKGDKPTAPDVETGSTDKGSPEMKPTSDGKDKPTEPATDKGSDGLGSTSYDDKGSDGLGPTSFDDKGSDGLGPTSDDDKGSDGLGPTSDDDKGSDGLF